MNSLQKSILTLVSALSMQALAITPVNSNKTESKTANTTESKTANITEVNKEVPTQKADTADLAPQQSVILEVNPLLIINQGLGINAEIHAQAHIAAGVNIEGFAQIPYDQNGVQATRNIVNVAPFVRYYFFSEAQEGLFAGVKLNLTYSQAYIKDALLSASYSNTFVAPTIHAGYRFVASNNITVSAYAGAGIKSTSNQFPATKIPDSRTSNQDWSNALDKMNTRVTTTQPDYGLTVGYLF